MKSNFYFICLLSILIGIVILLFVGFAFIFGSTVVEIPTYSDSYPIAGPNGTTFIEVQHEDDTTLRDFPFVNGTATVDIAEYQKCVTDANDLKLLIGQQMELNTLGTTFTSQLEEDKMLAMQNCIYLNSANQ